jgi:two-component system cell cycle sensor histidine kinase/response regulator CckA
MDKKQYRSWQKRIESLTAKNQSQRDRLSSLKEELKELRMHLKTRDMLFHSTPLGIIVTRDEEIIDVNRSVLDRLGFASEEVVGRSFLDLIDPQVRAQTKQSLKRSEVAKATPDPYETMVLTRQGDSKSFEVFTQKIRLKRRKAFVLNLVEIDERKQEEKKHVQWKKREAVATLISGLNYAMGPLLGEMTQRLDTLKAHPIWKEDDMRTGLAAIESSIAKLSSIVVSLDGLTGTGALSRQVTVLDPREIIEHALKRCQPLLIEREKQGKGIQVRKYLRKVSPIEGDFEQLQQLIANLISNGLEAMPEGGTLYLTTEEGLGFANIYVQDSGSGIPQKYMDRIFDPFFSTKGEGSAGMGLTLCEAIVERHHGSIEVTSTENDGTTFIFRLPLAKAANKKRAVSVRKGLKGSSILIVNAEDLLRELMAQVLEGKGCEVAKAANGHEGLYHLKRRKFDIVIAETNTPGVEGNIFWETIRGRYSHLPLVLLSGDGSDAPGRSHQEPEVDLVIPKPVDMSRVVSELSELLTKTS